MKQLAPSVTFYFLKILAFPSVELLVLVYLAIGFDFITGVLKAVVTDVERNSKGYRETIRKLIQYTFAIICVMILGGIAAIQGIFTNTAFLAYVKDGLCCFIIFVEVTSILENIYAIDKKSMLSKYFIQPLLRVMTFQIKNNSLVLQSKEDHKQKEII
jgi:phage-related holin